MKTQTDPEQLLDDILEEAVAPGLRSALLEQTLRAVRRRNHVRRTSRSALALAIIVAVCLVLWQRLPPAPTKVNRSEVASGIVRSLPLAALQVVETKPGSVPVIASAEGAVAVVRTEPGAEWVKELNDQDLLNLLAGRAVALVRSESGQTELIFLNPDDANGFAVQ